MLKPRRKLGIALLSGVLLLFPLALTEPAGARDEEEPDLLAPAWLGAAANEAMRSYRRWSVG